MHQLVFALTLVVTSHALILQTNYRDPISPGGTKNVELECKPRDTLEIPRQFKTLTKIQITKVDGFGNKHTVAEVRRTNSTVTKYDQDILVSGKIDEKERIYLKITWLVATEDTPGVYTCEVSGVDLKDDFMTIKSDPQRIEEKSLTMKDVEKLLSVATSKYAERQKALEEENANLRKYIDHELAETRQQIQDESRTTRYEISILRNDSASTYATKNELSSQESALKNFTEHGIILERESYQLEFHKLRSLIQDVNRTSRQQTREDVERVSSKIESLRDETLNYLKSQIDMSFSHLINHTKSAILSHNLENEHKFDELRESIQVFNKSVRERIQAEMERVNAEIHFLKNDTESKYATKNELSKQASLLKDFTKSEVISDRHRDQEKLAALNDFIQNVSASLHSLHSEMTSELSSVKSYVKFTLASFDEERSYLITQMNKAMGHLIAKINSLDDKFKDFVTQAREKDTRKEPATTAVSSPSTIATTSTVVSETSNKLVPNRPLVWPGGDYGLVSSRGNLCPALASPTRSIPGKSLTAFITINVKAAQDKFELAYCWQKASSAPKSSAPWPKGSYCIAGGQRECPKGFGSSSITYRIARPYNPLLLFSKDKRLIATYRTPYCCRSDGSPTTPIRLPTEIAFYLYRFESRCQAVQGMKVREDLIEIEMVNISVLTAFKEKDHPDTSGDQKINLCHYEPLV